MGLGQLRRGKLASRDLAFAHAGLPTLPPEPGGTPLHERRAPCNKCRAAVLGALQRYGIYLAKRNGRSLICSAPDQRGIGGVGRRTKKSVESLLSPARLGCIWLV